jgi:hypothetical protein
MLRATIITSTILGFAAGVPLAVPFPALAQGSAAGGVPEGTVLKSCAYSEAGSCPFQAVKGTDYLIRVRIGRDCGDSVGGKIELVNPAGEVTVTLPLDDTVDCDATSYGREFRAAYTATYHLRYTPGGHATPGPDAAGADLVTDCRADAKTRCAIPLGGGKLASEHSTNPDTDWFRLANLRRGRLYTITATAVDRYTKLWVVDAKGTILAKSQVHTGSTTGTVSFRPKANGTYFLEIPDGYHRTLSLR